MYEWINEPELNGKQTWLKLWKTTDGIFSAMRPKRLIDKPAVFLRRIYVMKYAK